MLILASVWLLCSAIFLEMLHRAPVIESWDQPGGSGAILDAGRATLELLSLEQAELVDDVEVGERVAGPVRIALEVEDSVATARALAAGDG